MKTLIASLLALNAAGWLFVSPPQETQDSTPVPKAQEAVAWKALETAMKESDRSWHPIIERESLSTGLYRLSAGATDNQSPHRFDEIYYVIEGKGTLFAGGEELAMEQGSIAYVARNVEHRFHDIEEDLLVLVFFAKPHE